MKSIKIFCGKLFNKNFITYECLFVIFSVIAIFLKTMYFTYTSEVMIKPYISSAFRDMLISTICIIVFTVSLFFLIFNRKRKIGFLILNILFTALLITDTIYFRKNHTGMTILVLLQIQFGNFGSVGGFASGLFKISDIVYLIDFPFIIFGLFRFWKVFKGLNIVRVNILKRLASSLILMVICSIAFVSINNSVDHKSFVYDKNYAIKYLGIYYFHYYDIENYINVNLRLNSKLSPEDKNIIINYFNNKPTVESKFKDIAKNKNLMIVQLESIQDFFINKDFNGQEITPNMNKLIKDSVYFSNFHYQIGGGNTSDAEFMCNTSLYPLRDGAVYFRYPTNTYESLPKILKTKGYSSFVFHAYKPSFWNRVEMYKAIGFNRFYSENDFKLDQQIGIGLSDSSLFTQSLKKIDKSKPFYSFMITLSSHFPFDYFGEDYPFNVGKYEGTAFGRYMKATNYVDKSIGVLIDGLKKSGLYDNTVLVIYGDHNGIARYQDAELKDYLNMDDSDIDWFKSQKIPCIIHYPGLKNGEVVSTTGGQMDILPTLANLMGFKVPHAMGKDLLNTEDGFAVLRNGSFYTDKYFYYNETKTAYDLSTKMPVNTEVIEDDLKKHQNELSISDMIIEDNALKKLKK